MYDLSGASVDQRLTNIFTRAVAGAGDATLIAGLVVGGSVPKRVMIRAAGPALAQFGLTGVLAQPQLTLLAAGSVTVAENAGWSASPDAALIGDAAGRVGACAFPAGSPHAARVVNLAPGSATAQVVGVGVGTGIVLLEVYALP